MDVSPLGNAYLHMDRFRQYSLRTTLLVTLVVGCGLGWLGSLVHARRVAEADRAAKQAYVTLEHYRTQGLRNLSQQRERQRTLKRFPRLANIESAGIFIRYHKGHATILNFCNVPQTADDDIASITDTYADELSALVTLSLENTQVTEKTIRRLETFPVLSDLWLDNCHNITDDAVDDLAQLQSLERIRIPSTSITDQGIAKLSEALPNCEIVPSF